MNSLARRSLPGLLALLIGSGGDPALSWVKPHPSQSEALPVMIVPKPLKSERLPGTFRFLPAGTSFRFSVRDTAGVMPAVEEICTTAVTLYGQSPAFAQKRPCTIWVGIAGLDPAFDRACRKAGMSPADTLGREGYTLFLAPGQALVAARETRGLFYGLESLNQLLRGVAVSGGTLPSMRILDRPDLPIRAVMDDISRGPVPTPAFFRAQIRRLAEMKVNTLSYYTEHVVATRSHPEFAPPGAALTIEEWKDLAQYARRYQIDLAGCFQSFGHFEKILAVPRYAHLGEGKSLLSPALEESYSFLNDIYSEMVPAFSAPFFLTNCDETFDLGRGPSRRLVDSLGVGRVYAGHILRLRDLLRQQGVRMMIWGDILLQHPEVIDLIPKDVVIGTWTYDTLADYRKYIQPFTSRGYEVLVTPGVLNSFSVIPNFRQSFINIQRFVRDGIACGARGAMTTVWDDGGSALFTRDWYGVAFAADRMWRCDTADISFTARFDPALYGDPSHGTSRGLEYFLQLAQLAPTDGMTEKNIWAPVIPEEGKTLRLNVRDWDQILALARTSDSLFAAARPLVYTEDVKALRFSADLLAAAARLRLGLLRASRLYAGAVETQAGGRPIVREDLAATLQALASFRTDFARLRDRFAALWLYENRPHALDLVEQLYDRLLASLDDAGRRVDAAREGLAQGKPLPPASAVRLALLESTGWYFRDWLVTGPILGDQLEADRLPALGGEREAAPAVTQEFVADGATYRWRRLTARGPSEIDFADEYQPAGASTMYAYATLESPSARTVRALLGVGGKMRLFLNGVQLFECADRDSLEIDRHTVTLPLAAGKNRLLLKICSGSERPWGFSFQIPEADIRGRKNRYRFGS